MPGYRRSRPTSRSMLLCTTSRPFPGTFRTSSQLTVRTEGPGGTWEPPPGEAPAPPGPCPSRPPALGSRVLWLRPGPPGDTRLRGAGARPGPHGPPGVGVERRCRPRVHHTPRRGDARQGRTPGGPVAWTLGGEAWRPQARRPPLPLPGHVLSLGLAGGWVTRRASPRNPSRLGRESLQTTHPKSQMLTCAHPPPTPGWAAGGPSAADGASGPAPLEPAVHRLPEGQPPGSARPGPRHGGAGGWRQVRLQTSGAQHPAPGLALSPLAARISGGGWGATPLAPALTQPVRGVGPVHPWEAAAQRPEQPRAVHRGRRGPGLRVPSRPPAPAHAGRPLLVLPEQFTRGNRLGTFWAAALSPAVPGDGALGGWAAGQGQETPSARASVRRPALQGPLRQLGRQEGRCRVERLTSGLLAAEGSRRRPGGPAPKEGPPPRAHGTQLPAQPGAGGPRPERPSEGTGDGSRCLRPGLPKRAHSPPGVDPRDLCRQAGARPRTLCRKGPQGGEGAVETQERPGEGGRDGGIAPRLPCRAHPASPGGPAAPPPEPRPRGPACRTLGRAAVSQHQPPNRPGLGGPARFSHPRGTPASRKPSGARGLGARGVSSLRAASAWRPPSGWARQGEARCPWPAWAWRDVATLPEALGPSELLRTRPRRGSPEAPLRSRR